MLDIHPAAVHQYVVRGRIRAKCYNLERPER